MKQVITKFEVPKDVVVAEEANHTAVFASKGGRLVGMVIKDDNNKLILKLNGGLGATGWHSSLSEVIRSCDPYGYTFHIDITV